MGFKLGTNRGNYATSGEIKTKLSFGRKPSGEESIPGTPIIRVPLEEGVMGEANMDGTIYVNNNIMPGSEEDLPTSERSVFYKNKSYTDKVYNKAIDDMIKDKDR